MTAIKSLAYKVFCYKNQINMLLAYSNRYMHKQVTTKYSNFDGDYAELVMIELGLSSSSTEIEIMEEVKKVDNSVTSHSLAGLIKGKGIKPVDKPVEIQEVVQEDPQEIQEVIEDFESNINSAIEKHQLNMVKMTHKPNGIICAIHTSASQQIALGYSIEKSEYFSKLPGEPSVVYSPLNVTVNRVVDYVHSVDGFTYEQALKIISEQINRLMDIDCCISINDDSFAGYYTVSVSYKNQLVTKYGWYRGTKSFFFYPNTSMYANPKFSNDYNKIVDDIIKKVDSLEVKPIPPRKPLSRDNEIVQKYLESLDNETFWKEYDASGVETLF